MKTNASAITSNDVIPADVRAEWSAWSEWTPCSRSCAGGVTTRRCSCVTRHGASLDCVGDPSIHKLCNKQPCDMANDVKPVDQRAEQCSRFDQQIFRGHRYKWLPHVSVSSGTSCLSQTYTPFCLCQYCLIFFVSFPNCSFSPHLRRMSNNLSHRRNHRGANSSGRDYVTRSQKGN